jgi:hypothetical protein
MAELLAATPLSNKEGVTFNAPSCYPPPPHHCTPPNKGYGEKKCVGRFKEFKVLIHWKTVRGGIFQQTASRPKIMSNWATRLTSEIYVVNRRRLNQFRLTIDWYQYPQKILSTGMPHAASYLAERKIIVSFF